MGKHCYVCKKKCTGDVLKAEGDKYIHISCFKCSKCSRSLREVGFFTGPNGQLLCAEDYQNLTSSLQIGIEEQAPSTVDTIPSSPPPTSPTVCAACSQPLQSGQVLLALGQHWHVWCFKCSECSAVLQGEYMSHEGKPYCLRDYNAKYGVRCYECDKFIAGKVLQVGGYKFHPTCTKCSRCGEHFGGGEEMYMQGDEIWHPHCGQVANAENQQPSNTSTGEKSPNGTPKYQSHLGQHLTYMYLLPEAEQTYLKHPIPPHPPQPPQFHAPQGPVKIRKSRMSMLKTGMQRLTEDLEKNSIPRAKSPHMDNEEPIEMAHYPAGHAPDPGIVPPIEREDFPAPPYPYAVEELKRRLSSSSVENDDDFDETDRMDEEKLKKAVEQLDPYDKKSSLAHLIKQDLEEAHKKQRQPLHWDPRNASRTPSAKKMPHLRFRYETPINASPSRHLNRPKPWIYWQGGNDKAATTSIPFFHIPVSRVGMNGRAATMPDGYRYGKDASMDGFDTTISSHFSDQSLSGGTLPRNYDINNIGTTGGANDYRSGLRSSLPDMSKPAKIYPLQELQTTNKTLPEDVDRVHLERHLDREEFEKTFGMSPIEFYKLPEWKRINLKRKVKLF